MTLTQWPRLVAPVRLLVAASIATVTVLTLWMNTRPPLGVGPQRQGMSVAADITVSTQRAVKAIPRNNRNTMVVDTGLMAERRHAAVDRKLIMLLTTMRSGSSFFAAMFDQSDETLLIFEPFFLLESFGSGVKTNYSFANTDEMKLDILMSIATCQFNTGPMAEIMRIQSHSKPVPRHFSRALVEPPLCPVGVAPRECPPIDTQTLNRICLSKKATVVKLIRLYDINLLKIFNEKLSMRITRDDDRLPTEWQVVHLVRDPRGTMNSRITFGQAVMQFRHEIYTHDYHHRSMEELVQADARKLCNEILSHIKVASKQEDWIKDHYTRVRFEDVAVNASLYMDRLFKLYGLDMPYRLKQWIDVNTHGLGADGYTYGINRKSELVPMKWKRMLETEQTRKYLEIVEENCKDVIRVLEYEHGHIVTKNS